MTAVQHVDQPEHAAEGPSLKKESRGLFDPSILRSKPNRPPPDQPLLRQSTLLFHSREVCFLRRRLRRGELQQRRVMSIDRAPDNL